jgi:hypothetical protein
MNKQRLKRRLARIISEVVKQNTGEMHRCLSGDVVTLDSPKCIPDLEFRIDDTKSCRDDCDTRSDSRAHYNGMLKVMRRKLRQARKIQEA